MKGKFITTQIRIVCLGNQVNNGMHKSKTTPDQIIVNHNALPQIINAMNNESRNQAA